MDYEEQHLDALVLFGGRQQLGKEWIDHAAAGVHRAQPACEFVPPVAVGGLHVLARDEWALVEQRDTVARGGEVIERTQERVPLRVVATRVDGVDGENFAVVRVRQQRTVS